MTGQEVAEKMLRENGIYDMKVNSVEDFLSDHFNPLNKTVNLIHEVYNGNSISSAVARYNSVCNNNPVHTDYPASRVWCEPSFPCLAESNPSHKFPGILKVKGTLK